MENEKLDVCPNSIIIRRKKENEGDVETDRIVLDITDDGIASIKNIIVQFDEAVSVKFLSFHVKNNSYCVSLKTEEAEKRFCGLKNINYVQFYFSLDGFTSNEAKYLVAFFPRFKDFSELPALANELCTVTEWLGLAQINCVVFRYGRPAHRGMDDSMAWQKKLNKSIEDTKKLSMVHEMEGEIKLVSNSLADKNLTVSKSTPLVKFNVS